MAAESNCFPSSTFYCGSTSATISEVSRTISSSPSSGRPVDCSAPWSAQPDSRLRSRSHRLLERREHLAVPEFESNGLCRARHGALASDKDLRHLPEQQPHGEQWRGKDGRPTQGTAQSVTEIGIGYRVRRGSVYGPAQFRRHGGEQQQACQVVAMDPRHPLFARADRPAETKLEGR